MKFAIWIVLIGFFSGGTFSSVFTQSGSETILSETKLWTPLLNESNFPESLDGTVEVELNGTSSNFTEDASTTTEAESATPRILQHPRNSEVKSGENVTVTCVFDIEVDCLWGKDGTTMSVGDSYQYLGDHNGTNVTDCSLVIVSASVNDNGIWTCAALGKPANILVKHIGNPSNAKLVVQPGPVENRTTKVTNMTRDKFTESLNASHDLISSSPAIDNLTDKNDMISHNSTGNLKIDSKFLNLAIDSKEPQSANIADTSDEVVYLTLGGVGLGVALLVIFLIVLPAFVILRKMHQRKPHGPGNPESEYA